MKNQAIAQFLNKSNTEELNSTIVPIFLRIGLVALVLGAFFVYALHRQKKNASKPNKSKNIS